MDLPGTDPRTSADSHSVDTLRLLTWEGFAPQWFVNGFEEQTGIKVNTTYAGTNDEAVSLLQRFGGERYDAVVLDHYVSPRIVREGLIDALDTSLVPHFGTNFPYFRDNWFTLMDGAYWGVPFAWGTMALVYDPAVVSDEEGASWRCMWDERLRGRIAQYDSPLEAVFPAARLLGFENVFALSDAQLDECGRLLRAHSLLLRGVYSSIETVVDWFLSGEVVAVHTWMAAVAELARRGKSVRWTIPREGSLAGVLQYHLVRGSPAPEHGYAFLRYATDPPVAAQICSDVSDAPCNPFVVDHLTEEARGRVSTDPAAIEGFFLYQEVEGFERYVGQWQSAKAIMGTDGTEHPPKSS